MGATSIIVDKGTTKKPYIVILVLYIVKNVIQIYYVLPVKVLPEQVLPANNANQGKAILIKFITHTYT